MDKSECMSCVCVCVCMCARLQAALLDRSVAGCQKILHYRFFYKLELKTYYKKSS